MQRKQFFFQADVLRTKISNYLGISACGRRW
jgi:hypothetical protein